MKTQTLIDLAGGSTKLANLLGITPGAISQWPEDAPQGRVWQLRVIRPAWFSDVPVEIPPDPPVVAGTTARARPAMDALLFLERDMTQTEAIKRHLQSGQKLTAIEALSRYGCLRLAARVAELRAAGIVICSERVTTRSGKHVAAYRVA